MPQPLHMPEYAKIAYAKACGLTPALPFTLHQPAGWSATITHFGTFQPLWVNRTTWHVLNPMYLTGIQQAVQNGMPAPEELTALLLEIEPPLEAAIALILAGGLDGWLGGIPDKQRVMDTIYHLLDIHPTTLSVLGPDLDYFQLLLDSVAGIDAAPPPAPQRPAVIHQPPPDSLDIPLLNLDLQIQKPYEFVAWGSGSRSKTNRAAHFYVDDYRWQGLLKTPETLQAAGIQAAIELNFSTQDNQPGALFYADLWRKRRVAATWQALGIEIAVDLNVARRYLAANLMGVPEGWQTYANRAYPDDLTHLEAAYEVARKHAGDREVLYLVYSGGKAARDLCQERGWYWLGDVNGTPTH